MRGTFTSDADPLYNNGTRADSDGVKYTDIVIYNGSYYRCKVDKTTQSPEDGRSNNYWELFSPAGDAAFNYLISNNAYIRSLTAKQIVVTDSNEAPVAGMVSADSVPTSLQESGVNSTGSIRIFAGPITGGNLYSCPFTVDDQGHVKADSITFTGSAGYISWGCKYLGASATINPKTDNCTSYTLGGNGMTVTLPDPSTCSGSIIYLYNITTADVSLNYNGTGNTGIFYVNNGTSTQGLSVKLPHHRPIQLASFCRGESQSQSSNWFWICLTDNVLYT